MTIPTVTRASSIAGAAQPPPTRFVIAATLIAALVMLGFGVWALALPQSFGEFIDFAPYNEHLIHDAGAFQVGIGITLLLALRWRDSLTVSLAGFAIGGGLHAVNHYVDLYLGGHEGDVWGLGALALLAAVALIARLRSLRRSGPELALQNRPT
jgi:hypothetical protein